MSHELYVEGNKVTETDPSGYIQSEKDYTRVQAGYKAVAHNPAMASSTREEAERTLSELEQAHADSEQTGEEQGPVKTATKNKGGSSAAADE
ncbi:hypothetical protein NBRC10512_006196 [Rhodotorula toruloides]|uniref:RHTO0S09e05270g1_1 n=2 Tax=Rhodotorula toruloides TaxID=5286 RepID=A0A061B3Z9_RHOTO|nr:uncharacterized protein RHTO_07698 [Rhodotorula toruloides NP11]EMS22828.1 hypothetical protein RHTO_07698 [Rhodotorula toruloides NP11]CDR44512.1 RHTO0S09e05270g1_1 [Rhodotorula toruloides]